jgi:hypothetical protein
LYLSHFLILEVVAVMAVTVDVVAVMAVVEMKLCFSQMIDV